MHFRALWCRYGAVIKKSRRVERLDFIYGTVKTSEDSPQHPMRRLYRPDTPVAESVISPAHTAVVITSIPFVAAATSEVFSSGMVNIVLSDLPARISKVPIGFSAVPPPVSREYPPANSDR